MFSRSFLVPFLATGLLAAPAAADRLLVAGSDGFVLAAEMTAGNELSYFTCFCGSGVIDALAADGQRLYAAGEQGQLAVFDVKSGALLNVTFPSLTPIRALAVWNGAVFAGNDAGEILRIDPASGLVTSTRTLVAGVKALAAHNGFLFAAAADGGIYRAPANSGEFSYFTCFCLFSVQDITVVGNELMIGDGFGTVARVSTESGNITSAIWVGTMDSMTVSRGTVLTYYTGAGGVIPRFDATTGEPLAGGFSVPVDVRAMLVIREEPNATGSNRLRHAPSPVQVP